MHTHPTALRCRKQAIELDRTRRFTRSEIALRCQISRTTLYKILHRFEEEGEAGLYDKEKRPGIKPNQTPPDIEEAVLDFVQRYPAYGPKRISSELRRSENGGIVIGETAVYGILKRHGLNTIKARMKWLDSMTPEAEKTAWELDREASKKQHVHAPHPGYLMSQDGKCIGRLAGIGRV
ncbi:helix-turn-helix domain-containing protein [Desulfurispora thermophila]|uniref:helix-turn-helix domain-containing protein n=1 Tax=Desulfurispora thermophila TaxID=265470 RepID=UPI001FA717D0|nr:helix-turn-helix domain-containing protein [Desulfurispora thermophila]